MKRIRFRPSVPEQIRAVEQQSAMRILKALHRYVEGGHGNVKPLSGKFEGLLRISVGNHRVIFEETEDAITVHRVLDRREAYR